LKETNVIILLPLLRRLSTRSRLAVGLALTTVGVFLLIAALAHGVTAVIVGVIFLLSVCRERQRGRLTYPSR
jgi:fucose permease